MKKLFYLGSALIATLVAFASCGSDGNDWTDYAEWRNANIKWYLEQKDLKDTEGNPYYTELSPEWYPNSGVLIHYFNDRAKTEGNISPLKSSKVAVKYKGMLYNGIGFDSTTIGPDSVRIFGLSSLIAGWKVALQDMRVGDTCEIVIPYTMGYGVAGSRSISPYSTLKFGMKLVDIPSYEIP